MQCDTPDRILTQANDEARSKVLRDVDTFADWLGGECYCSLVQEPRPSLRDVTAEDFADLPTDAVVALLLDPGQPTRTTIAARDVLAARYLATQTARIESAAAELVPVIVEAERFPEAA